MASWKKIRTLSGTVSQQLAVKTVPLSLQLLSLYTQLDWQLDQQSQLYKAGWLRAESSAA